MKPKSILMTVIFSLWLAATLTAQKNANEFKFVQESGGIKEYTLLKNDLQVLLMEDHSAPVLTFMVTYRVGSRNEKIGNTGSTHILEHMMFKGTPSFNKAKGTGVSATLQNVGAMMNATTWNDRTNYFEMIPSEHLELAVKIEADRMRNLLLDENDLKSEMTVVRNEFEIGENNPSEALDKNIWAAAYQAHPYHHSTIGWKADIENVSVQGLREFYETFYWPNNATVTVVGDFETGKALDLIYQYFGAIPKSPKPIPPMYTTEPRQEGPRHVVVKRAGQNGIVGVAHKTCKGLDKDQPAFDILETILNSGKNSRFYKHIVDKGLAAKVEVSYFPFKDESLFITYATLTPGTTHEQMQTLILEEYKKIADEGVTQQEIDAAKAQIRAQTAYRKDGSFLIVMLLNEAIAAGDWKAYTEYMDKINQVTAEDIRNLVKKYFVEDQMTTGYFIPLAKQDKTTGGLYPDMPVNGFRSFRGFTNRFDLPQIDEDGSGFISPTGLPQSQLARNITDKRVEGIRVIAMKTGVADVITIRGSLMAGTFFSPLTNKAQADLMAAMLDQGTVKRDKFAVSAALETIGATINFQAGNETLEFTGRCLKADLPKVINILAEELRFPAFDEKSFETIKKRKMTQYKQNLENTDIRAFETLSQKIYPATHPNYSFSTEQILKDIEKTTLSDLKEFHKKYYGPASMIIVAVGDVEAAELHKAVKAEFAGWKGGVVFTRPAAVLPKPASEKPILVTIPDKTSVTYAIGTGISIQQDHKDYPALFVGTYILGGNFSARLMSTVRDIEGLTYGIRAGIRGATFSDGYWAVNAYFNPKTLKQGMASTQKQIDLWLEKGVTDEEVAAKKSTITGSYKVGLSSTGRVAEQLLAIAQRNLAMSYIDDYPNRINALTTGEINAAIKKYIRSENLIRIAAGSVDEKKDLLESK